MAIYRQAHETPRCTTCGGSDIHTATCWTQTEDGQRYAAEQAASKASK